MDNPLTQYFRLPQIYVKLPSEGRFYHADDIELSDNGELAIHALTALDQMLLRTPDALLNGESLIKVVKNCVPGVKNPKKLVEPDINLILLAIKIASSGETSDLTIPCEKCSHENTYEINLNDVLETATKVPTDNVIHLNDALLITLYPYTFTQRNLTLLNEIKYNQAIKLLQNEDIENPEIISKAAQTVEDMSIRTFEIIAQSIHSITILKTNQIVTDRNFIEEFLRGISKPQSDVIIDKIKNLNNSGIKTEHEFTCVNCNYTWTQPLDFDPTSFFD
jgi:hypothetical protein